MGGFAYSDTAKNGLTIVVTARSGERETAASLAREIARYGWDNRARFHPTLTPVEEAVAKALAASRDPALPALCFADVADNPGGGGRGNTMYLLRAFVEAGVKGALFGVIYDPPLAAEAHRYGLHYHFDAHFNRAETTNFPNLGMRRRASLRCRTAIASAGAASMPGCGWPWGRARRWRSAESRSSSCRTGCNAPTPYSSR